jgi:hypothetical protein
MFSNPQKLIFNNRILRCFTDDSLGTHPTTNSVNAFHFVPALLESSACNTYVETVSDKADTLYLRLRDGLTEMSTHSYLDYIRCLSEKFDWKNKEFVLALTILTKISMEMYRDLTFMDGRKVVRLTGNSNF